MPNLYDSLLKVRNQSAPMATPGMQEQLEEVSRAKTGMAQQSTGPKASNLGEQQAQANNTTAQQAGLQATTTGATQLASQVSQQAAQQQIADQNLQQQTTQQLSSLAQKGQIQGAQLQQQQQLGTERLASTGHIQTNQISNTANQELIKLASEREATVDNLFRSYRRSDLELQDRRDASEIEQTAFLYSLQDKSYLQQLDQVAKERNMYDANAYRTEVQDVVWGQDLAKEIGKLGLQIKLGASDRDVKAALAQISLDEAVALANASARSEAVKSVVSGTVAATRGGLDYLDKQPQTKE